MSEQAPKRFFDRKEKFFTRELHPLYAEIREEVESLETDEEGLELERC